VGLPCSRPCLQQAPDEPETGKTITALSRRLQRENPRSLAGSMPFPHRWDPFFTPVMTVNDVYAYPTKHFNFHAVQLSLQRLDQP
jgi:hypothetical protein